MYYQNNNSQGTENWPSSVPDFSNIYSVPPPPLPPHINQETNVSTSIGTSFMNQNEKCRGDSYFTPALNIQHPSFPFSNYKIKHDSVKQNVSLPFSDLNVSTIKRDLIKCSSVMKEFERLLNLLQVFKKTLSNEDWSSRCKELKSKEEEINVLLNKYENPEYFLAVQRIVNKSLKKRMYRKRKKKEWQEIKKTSQAFREREHRRIDLWLEKMKDQVEKTRREEQVKGEADLVLSEVTAKKAAAKRYINLFNTLTKLRNARVQQLSSSGSFVSESESKSFNQVIEKLKKLWIDQLKEYNVEEQGLRVMLNDAEVERVNVEAKVAKQIHNKWLEFFFGQDGIKSSVMPKSLQELIGIRYEWDRFIVADNTCLSSKIPIGWIVPSEPSNSDWSKYLQK